MCCHSWPGPVRRGRRGAPPALRASLTGRGQLLPFGKRCGVTNARPKRRSPRGRKRAELGQTEGGRCRRRHVHPARRTGSQQGWEALAGRQRLARPLCPGALAGRPLARQDWTCGAHTGSCLRSSAASGRLQRLPGAFPTPPHASPTVFQMTRALQGHCHIPAAESEKGRGSFTCFLL